MNISVLEIEFLKILDGKYPKGGKILFVLDNLEVHKSAKIQEYISSVPDRFELALHPSIIEEIKEESVVYR